MTYKTDIILKYFSNLSKKQITQFDKLEHIYTDLNAKINIISRKDIEQLYLRHILHSLGIAMIQPFDKGAKVLDVGTGGGFPGIPLAIMYPNTNFHLVDSIEKKITVVNEIKQQLRLENVTCDHCRAETLKDKYDFIVSRAVAKMPEFVRWVQNKTLKQNTHRHANGLFYLKGGNLSEELKRFPNAIEYDLSCFFQEDFFQTKKVVYLEL